MPLVAVAWLVKAGDRLDLRRLLRSTADAAMFRT